MDSCSEHISQIHSLIFHLYINFNAKSCVYLWIFFPLSILQWKAGYLSALRHIVNHWWQTVHQRHCNTWTKDSTSTTLVQWAPVHRLPFVAVAVEVSGSRFETPENEGTGTLLTNPWKWGSQKRMRIMDMYLPLWNAASLLKLLLPHS